MNLRVYLELNYIDFEINFYGVTASLRRQCSKIEGQMEDFEACEFTKDLNLRV
jgi:hypothetical protein